MRRLIMLAAATVIATVVAACGAGVVTLPNCRRDGGIHWMRIQSVNATIIACNDGRIYRWDANGGGF